MGYSTDFVGTLSFNRPVITPHRDYINRFAYVRHVKRHRYGETSPDTVRTNVGLPFGKEGCYYVGGNEDAYVIDYNTPPDGQPGLWCQWVINDFGELEWDNGEKFYCYIQWINYLIEHFFSLWDYKLTGEIKWQGEDTSDKGNIIVKSNDVTCELLNTGGKRWWVGGKFVGDTQILKDLKNEFGLIEEIPDCILGDMLIEKGIHLELASILTNV